MKREMNNMKNSQTAAGQKPQTVPTRVLREQLRPVGDGGIPAAVPLRGTADLLRRAALPGVPGRGAREYAVVDQLLYVQNCRSALERCIAGSGAPAAVPVAGRQVTVTRFSKVRQGCVQAYGLQPPL